MKCYMYECNQPQYHDSIRGYCEQHHREYQAFWADNYKTQFIVNAKLSDGSSFYASFADVGDALQTVSRLRRLGAKPNMEVRK